jgi:GNAT superfamily N-acetyltransferase
VTTHPLARMLDDAARGNFPPFDARVEVLPSPGPPVDALVAFTGHFVLAADVDADAVAAVMPAGDLHAPLSATALGWLTEQLGCEHGTLDAMLVTFGDGTGAPAWLHRDDDLVHARRDEGARHRHSHSAWSDGAGSVLLLGRGLCGRWEVGYEVAPETRGHGFGRRLVAAARGIVPAGEAVWAQVAPGNAASMRSTLAAGFVPVGAEVLFGHR